MITLVVLGGIIATEVPRMEAQAANWDGRSIEKGAALFASNCAPVMVITVKVRPTWRQRSTANIGSPIV
ncbi:MAG: hypothetical protein R2911_37015 [Caldilineaceae bacterium]